MAENTGKNKAKLTALAQLIRILEDYKGITKVADLVSETGYTKQAIYKAKSELELTSQTELTESQPEWKSQPGLVNQSLQSQPEFTPRAYKESSSKINNTRTNTHTVTSEQVDGPRVGETDIGHGVFLNCQTIRHRDFTISIPAIEMAILGRMDSDLAKNRACGIALQWAAEIESGKQPRDVVPEKISNFVSATLIRDINRQASHEFSLKSKKKPAEGVLQRRIERQKLAESVNG